jgi:ribosome biogenesis GTPase / thiamine phosphate phosphatase
MRRKDARLQAEQRAMWKRIHKEVRGHNRP